MRATGGVTFGCVLADTGYGASADFRRALSARGLTWAVGIPRIQKVYPADVRLRMPRTKPGGRARIHPVPTRARITAEDLLDTTHWRQLSWRDGTKGPLKARFAAVRVVAADGILDAGNRHLPGTEAWLVGEWRANGERKYYLTNHSPRTTLRTLATTIKARWSCEQAHQQMKEELGLDHFEGRSWTGLHHHALMTMISFAFLQHLRLRETRRRKKNLPEITVQSQVQSHLSSPFPPFGSHPRPQWTATSADTPGDPSHPLHGPHSQSPLPEMSRAAHLRAPSAQLNLAE